MQRSARLLTLLALMVAWVATITLWPRRAPDSDLARLTWIGDAHQFGPVGYRDPAGALSPDGEWIAYSEGRFLRIRPAGGGPIVALPPGELQIRNLAWSPDNRTILADGYQTATGWALYDRVAGTRRGLSSDRDPIGGTFADGTEAKARIAELRQPSWSADGHSIAAIVNGREGQELWTVASDGASARVQRIAQRIAFP